MKRRTQQGFTLIEALVVTALLGISAVWALPHTADWLARQKANALAGRMQAFLRDARQEALRLNVPVYVCASQLKKDMQTDNHCRQQYWGQAFTAWADMNGNGFYDGKDKPASRDFYSTDTALKSLPLAQSAENVRIRTVWYRWEAGRSGRLETADVLAFMPDGSFRRFRSQNGAAVLSERGGGDTLMTFSVPHEDGSRLSRRSAALGIDGNGRTYLCRQARKDTACRFALDGEN